MRNILNQNVKLKKFGFRTMLPNAYALYTIFENNRERLSPWFWWIDTKKTPNFHKAFLFGFLYILDTKCKKIAHLLSRKKLYDEQFLILKDEKIAGMIGLDNIDDSQRKAEIWYFITGENEGIGAMSASLKILQDYAFNIKGMNLLYAKTASGNDRNEKFLMRNDYKVAKAEYSIPTSPRNPRITDLTTWEFIR